MSAGDWICRVEVVFSLFYHPLLLKFYSTWSRGTDQCPNSSALCDPNNSKEEEKRKRERIAAGSNQPWAKQGANGKQTNGQVMRELDEGLCIRENTKKKRCRRYSSTRDTIEGKKKNNHKKNSSQTGVEKIKWGAAILAPGFWLHDFWRKTFLQLV